MNKRLLIPLGVFLVIAAFLLAGLSLDPRERATWHAKVVVIDASTSFVTSANFTEWAQERNVEALLRVSLQDVEMVHIDVDADALVVIGGDGSLVAFDLATRPVQERDRLPAEW